VETISTNLETSWQRNSALGFRAPHNDGIIGGGRGLIDVYIYDLTKPPYDLGYAGPDRVINNANPHDTIGYICLDNALHPGPPYDDRQTIPAHEFFHLVQFAYNAEGKSDTDEGWLSESTADWFADEVFDDNNSYTQMIITYFKTTDYRLTNPNKGRDYASMIWHHFITDTFNDRGRVIRTTLENSVNNDIGTGTNWANHVQAIRTVLNVGWESVFYRFTVNNLFAGFPDNEVVIPREFRDTEAHLWPRLPRTDAGGYSLQVFDGSTRSYSGDGILAGGGVDYVKLDSRRDKVKITFDGVNNGNFAVSLARWNNAEQSPPLILTDFILNSSSKMGSLSLTDATRYNTFIIIRNMADGTSSIDRAWTLTFSTS
jgi:hypothetical protein